MYPVVQQDERTNDIYSRMNMNLKIYLNNYVSYKIGFWLLSAVVGIIMHRIIISCMLHDFKITLMLLYTD